MSKLILIEDIRKVKGCSRGARAFFKRHGLDWNDFIDNGIEEEVILATGDAMALDVVEAARGRRK